MARSDVPTRRCRKPSELSIDNLRNATRNQKKLGPEEAEKSRGI